MKTFEGKTYLCVVTKLRGKFIGKMEFGVSEGADMEEMMDGIYELIKPFEDFAFDVVFDTSNIKGEIF